MLYSEIDELEVGCSGCGSSWLAGRYYQIVAGGRLYSCPLCHDQFEVTEAMFKQVRPGQKVIGLPMKPKPGSTHGSDGIASSGDGRNSLIADAKKRRASESTKQ